MQNFPYEPGYVGELTTFTPEIGQDLERLIAQLNPKKSREIAKSDIAFTLPGQHHHIVVVEELSGRPTIVGTANISIIGHSYTDALVVSATPALWLGSLVVDESVRGKGVASRIWQAILDVGRANNVHVMQFTSNQSRVAAHGFYAKMGATRFGPVNTSVFSRNESGTTTTNTPAYDTIYELAAGHVALILSEPNTPPVSQQQATTIANLTSTQKVEEIAPVSDPEKARTVLFSVSF